MKDNGTMPPPSDPISPKVMNDSEKMSIVAEFDGWVKREHQSVFGDRELYDNPTTSQWLDSMPYLTSLDSLHPVAMKVLAELKKLPRLSNKDYYQSAIRSHCSTPPDNGQYADLFNSVYDAITFLSSQNKK